MQRFSRIYLPLLLFFSLSACQQKSEASFTESAPPPPPSEQKPMMGRGAPASSAPTQTFQDAVTHGDIFSSAAAVPSAIDSMKHFVRHAEVRFRVKAITEATLFIEKIAQQNGGFVVSSSLSSAIDLRHTAPVSRDSALETTRYTTQSQLVIRVPYQMLDTTLRSIGKLSDFLEMRQISAQDVGLQILEQKLTLLREGAYRTALGQSEENKLNPKADRARESAQASDMAQIETLKLHDDIRFSTVRIDLYQAPQIQHAMVANSEIDFAQASFLAQLGAAWVDGADVLRWLLFELIRLWGVILLIITGYFAWRRLRTGFKKAYFRPEKSA